MSVCESKKEGFFGRPSRRIFRVTEFAFKAPFGRRRSRQPRRASPLFKGLSDRRPTFDLHLSP